MISVNVEVTGHFVSYIIYISLLEHLHPHKHIYNAQTYKITDEHIYMVNFDNKIQRKG